MSYSAKWSAFMAFHKSLSQGRFVSLPISREGDVVKEKTQAKMNPKSCEWVKV